MSPRGTLTAIVFVVALGPGCGSPPGQTDESRIGTDIDAFPAPRQLQSRFGVGRAATASDVAALDIDVMPDGTGLPPGAGTADAGESIYQSTCMPCHGVDLEGTPLGDKLVPPADATAFPDGDVSVLTHAIGNYWPYATTIYDYVRRAMPFDRPGSMSDDDVYAVTAFLLWKNGIIDRGVVVNAETLPTIQMPARDRFVVDDRLTSQRVR